MAKSRYELAGAFHSRVYRSNNSSEFFILVPDLDGSEPGRLETQVFQVEVDPRSSSSETYQVFRKVGRRIDLENGLRLVGIPWGIHTILEPGADPKWEDVEKFKMQFEGTGCVFCAMGLVAAGIALGCIASDVII